jgi:hypothetical protein
MIGGSWALRREWIGSIRETQMCPVEWEAFEEWLVQRVTRWHQPKGQKRLLWDEIAKRLTLSRRVQSAVMDDLLGWTYERETSEKFTKHIRNGTLPTEEARRLLEKACQRWG